MKEKLSLLQDEKSALEKAKQVEIDELRERLQSKDKQLEDSQARISELERAYADSSKVAAKREA